MAPDTILQLALWMSVSLRTLSYNVIVCGVRHGVTENAVADRVIAHSYLGILFARLYVQLLNKRPTFLAY